MEHSRAEAWRTAAHDLRGSVTVVTGAASLNASGSSLPEEDRAEVAEMLSKGVSSLHEMLNDLLSLARLEAGHEQRTVTTFDAAVLLRDFCTASQGAATDRGLYLKMDGPSTLPVEGDKPKVLRILQNLLLNAVKYTERGGVVVSWGDTAARDDGRWYLSVQDSGPGFHSGPGTPLAGALAAVPGDPVVDLGARPAHQMPGEGLGLAIVKRLCELLNASIELDSEIGTGTTIRVLLPVHYAAPPA
jgi:signal transduction histidine kinase